MDLPLWAYIIFAIHRCGRFHKFNVVQFFC
ncbi:hypothetical protein M036_09835 [Bacillus subtilis TO-A]|nr:hypothetical protein M036_09835 [Bacillus subtilis TO-A]EXF54469.1 hypothetical protein Y647_11010 [Bacillus subtilis QH-1]